MKLWVIDRRFRTPDGREERYRRAAQVQTKLAAESEERRLIEHGEKHGTLKAIVVPQSEMSAPDAEVWLWEDAVNYWKEHVKPTKKWSTGHGYSRLHEGPHFAFWAGRPLRGIDHNSSSNA